MLAHGLAFIFQQMQQRREKKREVKTLLNSETENRCLMILKKFTLAQSKETKIISEFLGLFD